MSFFFQDLGFFVHNNPKVEAQRSYALPREPVLRRMRVTPLSVIVNNYAAKPFRPKKIFFKNLKR